MNLLLSEYEKYNRIMPYNFIREFGSGPDQGGEICRRVELETNKGAGTS